jgi:hypothetical protein
MHTIISYYDMKEINLNLAESSSVHKDGSYTSGWHPSLMDVLMGLNSLQKFFKLQKEFLDVICFWHF